MCHIASGNTNHALYNSRSTWDVTIFIAGAVEGADQTLDDR